MSARLLAGCFLLVGCEVGGLSGIEPGSPSDSQPGAVGDQSPPRAVGDDALPIEQESVGVGADEPFDASRGLGVIVNPDGSLSLSGAGGAPNVQPLIWVANSAEGTVSKLDTRTYQELGRYLTGDPAVVGGAASALSPSRTAVNRDGHVVVANRGFTSATRILAGNCPDRDGDGQVTTSTGGSNVLLWGQDECIDWFATFGNPGAAARGTVIEERDSLDGVYDEYAWVGAFSDTMMHEIRTSDGELTGRSVLVPMPPYGAALGRNGTVWVAGGSIASFNTTTLEVTSYEMPAGRYTYGITVDVDGNVWTGGSLQRFNPTTGEWDWPLSVEVINPATGQWERQDGFSRFVGGVGADAEGFVWAALGLSGGGILRVDSHTLEGRVIATGGSEHGVAPDADGKIWGIDFGGSAASIIDPETLQVTRVTPPFNGAYTYSDMTGTQAGLQNQTFGRYRHPFAGCDEGPTEWRELSWEARVPAGSHVAMLARIGDTLDALGPAEGIALGTDPNDISPINVMQKLSEAGVEGGASLEIEVRLFSDDGAAAPTLLGLGATYACPGLFL